MTAEAEKSEEYLLEERLELQKALTQIEGILRDDKFYTKPQSRKSVKTVDAFLRKTNAYFAKIADHSHQVLERAPYHKSLMLTKVLGDIPMYHKQNLPVLHPEGRLGGIVEDGLAEFTFKEGVLALFQVLNIFISLGSKGFAAYMKKENIKYTQRIGNIQDTIRWLEQDPSAETPEVQQRLADARKEEEKLRKIKDLRNSTGGDYGDLKDRLQKSSLELLKLKCKWVYAASGLGHDMELLESSAMKMKGQAHKDWVGARVAEIKDFLQLQDDEISIFEKPGDYLTIRIYHLKRIRARLFPVLDAKQVAATETSAGDAKAQQLSIASPHQQQSSDVTTRGTKVRLAPAAAPSYGAGSAAQTFSAQVSTIGSKTDSEHPHITQLKEKIKEACPKLNSRPTYKWDFREEVGGKEFLEGTAMNVSALQHKEWFDARVAELKQHLALQEEELSIITKSNGYVFIRINDPKKIGARLFPTSEVKQATGPSAGDSKSQQSPASVQPQQNSNNIHRFLSSGATLQHASPSPGVGSAVRAPVQIARSDQESKPTSNKKR